ncbi:MAG: DedA family protein [Verrucomicrobiales bacterium]
MFDWLTEFVKESGYWGIAFLMMLENAFPPIPSELIMPLAGFNAAEGHLSLPMVVVAGSIGSVAGALIWYYLGRWLGCEGLMKFARRHGRFLTVTPDEIDRANEWFSKHSARCVFFGRLVPAVRTLISAPAGIARMPLPIFLLYSTAGTIIWTALLAVGGYMLKDQYEKVSSWINPISNVLLGALVVYYIYRVVTFRPGQSV